MKNITITIDDETHRQARIRAAEMGTSVSALVKEYLGSLIEGGEMVGQGVREMPMPFNPAPADIAAPPLKGPEGQPYFVNGKWTFTKDGKPRKPGALRGKIWIADDFDEWPDGFINAMYGEDTEAANNWWKPFANPPKKSSLT